MAGAQRRGDRALDGGTRNEPVSDELISRIEAIHTARLNEAERVQDLARRDCNDAKAERRRKEALTRVASGDPTSAIDAAVPPTPEWLAKVENRRVMGSLDDWTDQRVPTYRRVTECRIVQLHSRGVIDDDLFAACRWYRSAWERSGLDQGASISAYDADPRGEKLYGVMARTEAQVEARDNYRFARETIPTEFVDLFDSIVLEEHTIEQAALLARIRKESARNRFIAAALALHGGIAHLLPVRLEGRFCIGPDLDA